MTLFITLVHIVVCFVLILVILLQAGRGQGLTGPSFASGNVQSLFGTGAADFLTKATSVSAICFLLTCITLNYMESKKSRSLLEFSQKSDIDADAIKKALEALKAEKDKTQASDAHQKEAAPSAAESDSSKTTSTASPSAQESSSAASTQSEGTTTTSTSPSPASASSGSSLNNSSQQTVSEAASSEKPS